MSLPTPEEVGTRFAQTATLRDQVGPALMLLTGGHQTRETGSLGVFTFESPVGNTTIRVDIRSTWEENQTYVYITMRAGADKAVAHSTGVNIEQWESDPEKVMVRLNDAMIDVAHREHKRKLEKT